MANRGGTITPTPTPTIWGFETYEVSGGNPSLVLQEKLLWTDEIVLSSVPKDKLGLFRKTCSILPENALVPTKFSVSCGDDGKLTVRKLPYEIRWHGVRYKLVSREDAEKPRDPKDTSILPYRIRIGNVHYQRDPIVPKLPKLGPGDGLKPIEGPFPGPAEASSDSDDE